MPDKSIGEQVAEACGIAVEMRCPVGNKSSHAWRITRERAQFPWNGHWFDPEHDANDAVLAAERFGLFDNYKLSKDGAEWHITEWDCDGANAIVVRAESFCSCICQAILYLAANKPTA